MWVIEFVHENLPGCNSLISVFFVSGVIEVCEPVLFSLTKAISDVSSNSFNITGTQHDQQQLRIENMTSAISVTFIGRNEYNRSANQQYSSFELMTISSFNNGDSRSKFINIYQCQNNPDPLTSFPI